MTSKNKILENFSVKDFYFYGEPVYRPVRDYDDAISRLINLSKKDNNVLSIYTFGEVKCPGISDLDFIFVLKDTNKLPRFLRHMPKDKIFNYVIYHPFFIIDKEIMENMDYIYPTSDFRHIYGKKITIKRLSNKEFRQSLIFLTADVVFRHYPSDFITTLLSKRINVRMCLLRLNSLGHSIDTYMKIKGNARKDWKTFRREILDLRKNWFDINPNIRREKVIRLMKQGVYISQEFIDKFKGIYVKEIQKKIKAKQDVLFKGTKIRLSFVNGFDKDDSTKEIIKHFKKYSTFYSIFPIDYVYQLWVYASLKGRLSSYIRRRLSTHRIVKTIPGVLKKRVQLMNRHTEISSKLRHQHFPCFFPLGYKNTSGIENKIRYIAIIIISSSIFRKIIYPLRERLKLF